MTWFCTPCRGLAVQAAQTDKLVEDRCRHYMGKDMEEIHCVNNELKKDIRAVSTSVTQIVADIDTLKRDMKDHEDKVDRRVDDKLHDATTLCLEEFREREERKLNIIVFNVPESEKESDDGRKNDNLEYLRGMMSDVELNVPFPKSRGSERWRKPKMFPDPSKLGRHV